jgi:hypothetical protein
LISRVNTFFQHYHISTNLGKKLDALLGYLQLQIGTPSNPFLQDYDKWGNLAPLSWVKLLWKLLHHFEITLQMKFPTIAPPRESDKVIMDIVFEHHLDTIEVARLNRCHVSLQAISCRTSRRRMENILRTLSSIQEAKLGNPGTLSLERSPQDRTGTGGSISGTSTQQPEASSNLIWEGGLTPSTGYGNGITIKRESFFITLKAPQQKSS